MRSAQHRAAKLKCAIKIIRKNRIAPHKILVDLMKNELQILEDTSHPHILRIYELLEDDSFYFVVSEFVRFGELYDYIVKRGDSDVGPMTEKEVKIVARQIFYALNYMHQKNIAHRDIKPENILIDSIEGSAL